MRVAHATRGVHVVVLGLRSRVVQVAVIGPKVMVRMGRTLTWPWGPQTVQRVRVWRRRHVGKTQPGVAGGHVVTEAHLMSAGQLGLETWL